jgi:outer membrane lipoprotein LolB
VHLSGPFGAGAYEISWDADSVEVTGKAGEVEIAYAGPKAAEQFLEDQLGWSFPAMSLRYWMLGVPDPGFESDQRFDAEGWLAGILQGGWSIEYDDFEHRNAVWLPKRIVMNNDDARVRLIVDDWLL